MPVTVSNISLSDEFISGDSGLTPTLNALVGDKITATIDCYYENNIDAGVDSAYRLRVTDGGNLPLLSAQYPTNIVVLLNADLSTVSNYSELLNNEITTTGFTSNYTGNVIDIRSNVNGTDVALILDTTGTQALQTRTNATCYFSGTIESINFAYRFNGTTNNNVQSPALEILNSNQGAEFANTSNILDATSATVQNIPFKYNGAYQTGSLTVAGVPASTTTTKQAFQIVHTFEATPISIYDDGNTVQPTTVTIPNNDLINGSLFNDLGNSKYGFIINFLETPADNFPVSVNKNNVITTDVRPKGQKIRGGATNYSTSNFSIVRTSDSYSTDVPIVTEKFTVSFDIDNTTDTPFSNSNTKVKVGILNIPYNVDNTKNYEQAFLYDRAVQTLGAGAIAGESTGDAASITNYTATFNSSSQVSISFDVEFTSNAQTQINLNTLPNFFIFAETQNHTLDYTNSDRVVLDLFLGEGIQVVQVDPITVQQTRFLKSPFSTISNAVDNTEIDGFPVELLVGISRFSANWTNRDNLRINKVTQSLVLKNSSTSEEINLNNRILPVNVYPLIDNKYPSFNTRTVPNSVQLGFQIPNNEIRASITAANDGDVGDTHYFQVTFPFFVRWEDYTPLILQNVPSTIIDTNEPLDGLNYDLHRIDNLVNWSVNYRLKFDCNEGATTFEQEFDVELPTSDYNSHPQVTNRVINSFKEDGVTSLTSGGTKYIDSEAKTMIVGEWTLSTAPSLTSDFEIEFYIEGYENGSPTKIQRISSVNGLLASSWFTSIDGSGNVVKSIDGSKAVGKVFIDNSKLIEFDSYRVYGTFYNPPKEASGFITEGGDNLITEDSNDLISE